jgi:hypothetical protein
LAQRSLRLQCFLHSVQDSSGSPDRRAQNAITRSSQRPSWNRHQRDRKAADYLDEAQLERGRDPICGSGSSCWTAKASPYRSARSTSHRHQPVRYNLAGAMGRPLAPGGAQYSAAFSPWLTRSLRTIQFIDDRASGSERCLTDGHGCLQSGDASRPNTMLLRIPFLRVWRHSSGNSNSRLIAVWTAPVGLQNPRTVMRAPRRRAPVTRIRSQRF